MFVSADRRLPDRAVRPLDDGRDGHRRPVLRAAAHLRVRPAVAEPSFGTRTSTSISSGASAVWKTPVKNSPRRRSSARPRYRAATSSPSSASITVGRSEAGIAMCERAADRPAVTHLRIADLTRCVRRRSGSARGGATRAATSLCRVSAPIAIVSAVLADVREVGEPADVDEERRPGEAELHRRQERVPAGEQLRVLPLAEELDRVLGALGDLVVERSRDHDLTSWIARQTRSGVAGIWTSVTPRCESASTTALMTAGAAAIVPVSPTPFTPSGLSARVSIRSVS